MGTIAKGEITLSPVNDAYTVSITPASCTIKADFDGSNPQLDNAKGTITIKRGTRDVPFHVVTPHISTGGSVVFTNQTSSIVAFEVTSLPSNVLNGTVGFDIKTDDGFDYQTTVQFAFTIVRESTMLDWIKDWEGSKTKVGGTYIMTPKLFVGKKEDVCHEIENESADGYEVTTEWIPGALTGVYIGPDLLSNGESSVGIYGYLKDEQIFHINADGGFIGGWTFNEAGLQSSNGVVNILAEGSMFAQNPDSTTEYWGIYADGHATFANGNVKFMANGSAEYAGKITSTSGKIGGWSLSENQLHSGHIILDSANGYIGIHDSKYLSLNVVTGDYNFPTNPNGGVKLWYSSASDFGFAAWTAGKKVLQLGAYNMIAGWNFNHQAIWTGGESPYLSQGSFATNSGELTLAPNGIRSTKWYMDADGTAQFVGGKVQFNENNAEMFGWKMRNGRFSAEHAALTSSSYWCGVFVSPTDLTDIDASSLTQTINKTGGIYMYSDAANSAMRAYDKNGNLGFALQTNGYHTIGNWHFDHQSIYIGNSNLSPEGYTLTSGSMVLATSGITGYAWKLNADGSGALAGGKINWDTEGNLLVDAKISANNITAGTISTAAIKNGNYWGLNLDGSGYLASSNITWDKDGNTVFTGEVNSVKGKIGGWTIAENHIRSDNSVIMLVSKWFNDTQNGTYYSQGIYLTSEVATGGSHVLPGYDNYGAKISLVPSTGTVEASLAKYTDYSTGTAYISPTGIFANLAGTQATSVGTGLTHRAAIVGLGFAKLNKEEWELGREMTAIAGIYGRASNSGTAPAYGGYFVDLKACGLIANMFMVSDSTADGSKIGSSYTYVCGITNSGVTRTLYLPTDGMEGRIIIVKQLGAGALRIDTLSGQSIFDDNTENDYYDVSTGQMAIFTFQVYYINKVRTEVWSVNKFKF